jgi:hypothetical protein
MDKHSRRFLSNWVLACIVLAAAVAIFNVMIDPYLLFNMPRIDGFNARKPSVETQERLIKAYDVLRARPNTLILGTSRVAVGLDARDPVWPEHVRSVYNLGLGGAPPYVTYRYLQHVISQRHLELVVLGLDFELFLSVPNAQHPTDPDFEARLSVTRDGSINASRNLQRIKDVLHGALSFDALSDSAATLTANFQGESSDLVAGNLDWNDFRYRTSVMGSYPLIAMWNLLSIRYFRGSQQNQFAMGEVQSILDLCESHGTRVILFISPSHADQLEILDLLGLWQPFENWKRELVAMTAKYSGTSYRSGIALWDFSGYDSYSTENMPIDRRALHWWWDSVHYTRALGDAIVERIFGTGDPRFGVLLSPEGIEPHLADIRNQRLLYREHHYADVRRVRALYNSLSSVPSPYLP